MSCRLVGSFFLFLIFLLSNFTSEIDILTISSFLFVHLSKHLSTLYFMNESRSKHLDIFDFKLVRGSFEFEGGTSSKREEIVERMG